MGVFLWTEVEYPYMHAVVWDPGWWPIAHVLLKILMINWLDTMAG